jgi:hypothetical protein
MPLLSDATSAAVRAEQEFLAAEKSHRLSQEKFAELRTAYGVGSGQKDRARAAAEGAQRKLTGAAKARDEARTRHAAAINCKPGLAKYETAHTAATAAHRDFLAAAVRALEGLAPLMAVAQAKSSAAREAFGAFPGTSLPLLGLPSPTYQFDGVSHRPAELALAVGRVLAQLDYSATVADFGEAVTGKGIRLEILSDTTDRRGAWPPKEALVTPDAEELRTGDRPDYGNSAS